MTVFIKFECADPFQWHFFQATVPVQLLSIAGPMLLWAVKSISSKKRGVEVAQQKYIIYNRRKFRS